MQIEITPITYEMKSVLRNLLELYEHDSSEFNGSELNEHGLYEYKYVDHYWTEEGRYAYFVRVDGKLAGFALVRALESSELGVLYSMSEFFLVRKFRRQGIGSRVAKLLFDMFPGRWEVSQEAGNKAAQEFWKRVIGIYTKEVFQMETLDGGPLLLFDNMEANLRRDL